MDERTLPDLTRDVALGLGDLLQSEVRLARAETIESIKGLAAGLITTALGVALAAAGVTLGLFAVAYRLEEWMPMWAAALVAALVGGVLAWMLISSGKKTLAAASPKLPKTTQQVSRDLHALKETITP